MTLLEEWREKAYGESLGKKQQEKLWERYFEVEKGIYEKILEEPSKVYEGSLRELSRLFGTDIETMTGFMDGIDDSLKGFHNPLETMDADTPLRIEIDPEALYKNMVAAKAPWLYGLSGWEKVISGERRKELFREQKASGTVKREGVKIYPNDPCPCGSGKKYKKCCGRNAS